MATLSSDVLKHLEEWDYGDRSDTVGDLSNAQVQAEVPLTSPPPVSRQIHPLWDRELDG